MRQLVHGVVSTVIVILLSGPQTPVAAQVSARQDAASFRADQIARAESEGVAYPALPTLGSVHPMLTGGAERTVPPLVGSGERKCVVGQGTLQSGEWVIGGSFTTVVAGKETKIWWAPWHHSKDMPPLHVFARSLIPPVDSFTFHSSEIAFPIGGDLRTPVPEADRKYFFPSGFTAPRSGLWLLTVTSGPNWGCFILKVHSPML